MWKFLSWFGLVLGWGCCFGLVELWGAIDQKVLLSLELCYEFLLLVACDELFERVFFLSASLSDAQTQKS